MAADGNRVWLYPRETSGRFTRKRKAVAWVLMALYLGFPWLRWEGAPLFRLDVAGRRLELLGQYFRPQDIPLFLPGFFAFILVVFLATARFGRVWCGWACPQTVFLQFLFAPMERLIEGRASRRQARDRGPFTADWLGRKLAKHVLFAAAAFLIGNTALAYAWGTDNLLWAMAHPSRENWPGLALVLAFSAAFYYVFAFFREQACVLVCPYARFQSVLVDEKTSQIAYDAGRGEPRGKRAGGAREGLGDCTDCLQCVLVCPTGIDIRHGSQMECIGCARCIDACDRTMAAWKKPAGLIRYASLDELQGKPLPKIPWRPIAYGFLALVMASLSAFLLERRPDVGLDLLRRGQTPYLAAGADSIRNTFTLHVRNNEAEPRTFTVDWDGPARGAFAWQRRPIPLGAGQSFALPLDITAPASAFARGTLRIRLRVDDGEKSRFLPVDMAGPWGR